MRPNTHISCEPWKDRAARRIAAASLLALALAFAAPFQHAAAAGGVYVSGQGIGLDQAFRQALTENSAGSGAPFWIVVAGAEIARVTKGGATGEIAGWMKTVRERGGLVYVCRADMMRAGIKEEELLEGVVSMYGYGARDWTGLLPARQDGIALPDNMGQSQLILKTCAGEGKPL